MTGTPRAVNSLAECAPTPPVRQWLACPLQSRSTPGSNPVSETARNPSDESAATIYCTQCGQAMRIATEHVYATVACPHCQTPLEPWRAIGASGPPPPVAAPASSPVPTSPPDTPHTDTPQAIDGYSPRSKVVAGVLGILLGGLGVHRFYLGYVGIGILQIFVTFLGIGFCFSLPFPFGAVWGFVEGILCLTGHFRDVDGRPLRD